MYKTIIKTKEEWTAVLDDISGRDLNGLGIDDYKGHYFYGKYEPEKYPFILMRGDFISGHSFDHEKFVILYPEDFERKWKDE